MSDRRSDAKLAKKLRRRDPRALRQLVDRYSRLMWAVASGHLPRFAGFEDRDVEECVSDVFMAFAQHPERYDETRGSLQTYLCTLTRNKAIDRFRAQGFNPEEYFDDGALAEFADVGIVGGRPDVSLSARQCGESSTVASGAMASSGAASMDAGAWRGIDYQALYDAVNVLPDHTREIVLRRYFMEQKPAAIARAMGLSVKEVDNRLYRAKRSLAKALGVPDASFGAERKEGDDDE